VVADSALSSEDHLALLKDLPSQWSTRVPGTLNEVKAALAQADPAQMGPLQEGSRGQTLPATSGGVAQRWLLLESQPRCPPARRTVNTRWLKHSEKAGKALQTLGRRELACEADARHALATFEPRLTYTQGQTATLVAPPHDAKPGRPKSGEVPSAMRSSIEGARGSPVAAHEQRVRQARCVV